MANENKNENKIFLTKITSGRTRTKVQLAVFLKGEKTLLNDMKGFLQNQNVSCSSIMQEEKKNLREFSYFDEGFFIHLEPNRWTFHELKSFIETYTLLCEQKVVLHDDFLQDNKVYRDEEKIFDDRFYIELTREIDRAQDMYYRENMSISLFVNAILKILRQNLQLYWCAVKLIDYTTGKLSYLNFDPPSFPKKDIVKGTAGSKAGDLLRSPIVFCDEHLADFILQPGPFSPPADICSTFLKFVIRTIDAFMYGHIVYKREMFSLKSEIAELKKTAAPAAPVVSHEREQKARKKMQLLLLGSSQLSSGQLYGVFSQHGYDRNNVDIYNEWDKYKTFDTNNLLAVRSRYDGILLGPVPHSMKGTYEESEGLIAHMQREPERYPPFVVVRDKSRNIKITKSSLKSALGELGKEIERIEKFL